MGSSLTLLASVSQEKDSAGSSALILKFSSSNSKIVTVNPKTGLLKAIGFGEATISVELENIADSKKSIKVKVIEAKNTAAIQKSGAETKKTIAKTNLLSTGKTKQLK